MAAPRVLAIVLAGGEGKRLMPLTADRAKPAVPFGGIVPARRLRPVEPHQLAVPARHRAHPVQVPQPRPARVQDVAHVAAAGQLRRRRARAAARRQALVPGQRRRDLPVPQHHRGRAPRHRGRGRRRPRVPHGLLPDGRRPHRVGRRVHRRRASASRSSMADQFGVIEIDADGPRRASRRSSRSRPNPVGPGRLPRRDPRVDGQLRRQRRRPRRARSPPTPRT